MRSVVHRRRGGRAASRQVRLGENRKCPGLVAGGVAHHFEERGNMMIWEKGSSDVAESYFEYVVELIEVDAAGKPGTIHVIRGGHLDDLDGGAHRVFRFPGHDFGL